MTTTLRNFLIGLVLGFALCYLFHKNNSNPLIGNSGEGCNVPMPTIQIDPNGGFTVTPGQSGSQDDAASINYTITNGKNPDPKLQSTSPDSSFSVDMLWDAETTEVKMSYVNANGDTITCHQFKIGDGIILSDVIVINKEGNRGDAVTCGECAQNYPLINNGLTAVVATYATPKKYLISVGTYTFLFENKGGNLVLIKQCGGNEITTTSTATGLICQDASNKFLFNIKASTLGGNLYFDLENLDLNTAHVFSSICAQP